jgi:hypothetical protein
MASIVSPSALLRVVNHVEPAQNYEVALLVLEYKSHSENNLEDNKLNCKVFLFFVYVSLLLHPKNKMGGSILLGQVC